MEQLPVSPVPEGRWWAAVSGGADSVAMLLLCRAAVGGVMHFDHETRAGVSGEDARFVEALAGRLGLACVVGRRSAYEGRVPEGGASSDRFRRMRLAFYREVVGREGLAGVLLGHHADDRAETIALRLTRGAGPTTLRGMAADTTVAGVRLFRPMLGCRKAELIAWLRTRGQDWREDASNASGGYARNRLRAALTPEVAEKLRALGDATEAYATAITRAVPALAEVFRAADLTDLPAPVAREALRGWLSRSAAVREASPEMLERLLAWTRDAAGPIRFNLPCRRHARRRRGLISIEEPV